MKEQERKRPTVIELIDKARNGGFEVDGYHFEHNADDDCGLEVKGGIIGENRMCTLTVKNELELFVAIACADKEFCLEISHSRTEGSAKIKIDASQYSEAKPKQNC